MADAIQWPTGLPTQPLVDGYGEQMPDNVLRSSMDVGIAKVRRKGAALPWTVDVKLLLTASQKAQLSIFYRDTLVGGTYRFQWMRYTGMESNLVDSRFASPPKFDALVGGLRWYATFKLEILP